ncbi:hypothetical protein DES53_115171 [Roseimicrobium gellanilyticum]|uniref:Uncharacterized protein n=1 Tax=Roseimicrobium gellanilyticum TaxID=748857 RepID=A0A366H7R8_9BACT|nr:hypothetical protein [Roseimicrobium gellanilyticum]RBP37030.1 hypothetical protein DES53_115171 [Roseimicrobium gellanilyticum]
MKDSAASPPRLAVVSLCLCITAPCFSQNLRPGVPEIRIEAPVKERMTMTPVDSRALMREGWELPMYLLKCETPESVPSKILKQTLDWDKRYFEHLGLTVQSSGESQATKAHAQFDAVRTPYTMGTLRVETLQTVWVWALWVPFSEEFKSTEAPKNVSRLMPALHGNMTWLDRVDGKTIYFSESASGDAEVRVVHTMVTGTGVLLWGLKGNWKSAGTPISSQPKFNEGWFRSAEGSFK